MYFVKYGDKYLYDPRDDAYVLTGPSFSGKQNTCGYFDFDIYANHPMHDKIRERDIDNPVRVYDNDDLIFEGVIYELGEEFYLNGKVKCMGELSYLKDSIVRPYSTLSRSYGTVVSSTVDGYFQWLIDQHNNQVEPNKQFRVGINQGAELEENNYIYRENDEYPNTFDEITNKIIDLLGGYLRVRYVDGVRYIDLLSECSDVNSQILDFGVNLTDYTRTNDASSISTYVVPLGAQISNTAYSYNDGYSVTTDTVYNSKKTYYTKGTNGYSKCTNISAFVSGTTYYEYDENKDESKNLINISSLPDGPTEYEGYSKLGDKLYCDDSVKKYGWVGTTYKNTDVTVKENLIPVGLLSLMNVISPKTTIEIKAVDMHLINPDIKFLRIGEYVRARSAPHKLDSYFLCVSITLDLDNPDNSLYTLGTTFDTLTGQQNEKINALNSTINAQYEAAKAIGEDAKNIASDAAVTATEAKTTADGLQGNIDTSKQEVKDYTDHQISTYSEEVTQNLNTLQSQIDGSIMTWFYGVPPTDSTLPTVDWTTTDLKNNHLGDLYYDTNTGYCYRYQVLANVYSWQRITDTDVTKALADAAKAQDTADSKRRTFLVTPTTPYDVGDLWVQGTNGDLMTCTTSKSSGEYVASDWSKQVKYTDDTQANLAKTAADNAQDTANAAVQAAGTAQTSADGKNTVFYSATAPTAKKVNDLWFNTSDSNKISYWNGTSWVVSALGKNAVTNLDAGSITSGYLAAARIQADSITSDKLDVSTLSAITANLGNVNAGTISLNVGNYTAIPTAVQLGIYGKNTTTGLYDSSVFGLDVIYMSKSHVPYGAYNSQYADDQLVYSMTLQLDGVMFTDHSSTHDKLSALTLTYLDVANNYMSSALFASGDRCSVTNTAAVSLAIASSTTTECSVSYTVNGLAKWSAGAGAGTSATSFGWKSLQDNTLKMSLSNVGDLTVVGIVQGKNFRVPYTSGGTQYYAVYTAGISYVLTGMRCGSMTTTVAAGNPWVKIAGSLGTTYVCIATNGDWNANPFRITNSCMQGADMWVELTGAGAGAVRINYMLFPCQTTGIS